MKKVLKLREALTAYDKVKMLNDGTRGFNASAASESKLLDYYTIAVKNKFNKARDILEQELANRKLHEYICPLTKRIMSRLAEINPAAVKFVHDRTGTELYTVAKTAKSLDIRQWSINDVLTIYLAVLLTLGDPDSQTKVNELKDIIRGWSGVVYANIPNVLEELAANAAFVNQLTYAINEA